MRIGIDCHNLEGQRTGVGRYLWNLLKEWANQDFARVFVYNMRDHSYCIQFFLYFKKEVPHDLMASINKRESMDTDTGTGMGIGKATGTGTNTDTDTKVNLQWNFRVLKVRSNALFKHWFLPRAAAVDKIDVLFCADYVLPLSLITHNKVEKSQYTNKTRSYVICVLTWLINIARGTAQFSPKTALTLHDIIYEARPNEHSWPSWADKILLKWASNQSAKRADIIFTPSEFTKGEIIKHYQVHPEKIAVTPLAPDQIFRKLERTSPPALGGGTGESGLKYKKYVLFVGSIFNRRFLPQKIQGFVQFAKNHSDFKFLAIGKNHTKPYIDIGALVSWANRELGREAVIWREHAADDKLVYLYNGAFATLWLSSYEGFGLPILESMACGTPVITNRAGSLPEVACDAALYIDNPQDPDKIAASLSKLASGKLYYESLARKSLPRAKEFSWQRCAQKTHMRLLRL